MDQEEYIGFGTISKLEDILISYNPNKIFLVTGKKSYTSCGVEKILKRILGKYNVQRFYDFETNPKIEDVTRGIELFKQDNYDLVLSVGGGNVIDMAKLINILSTQTGEPIEYIRGEKRVENKGKPLVAIPTTAGTGTEATHFAVVYINKKKYSLANKNILPNYVIMDTQFTVRLPSIVTASTGIDALSHALESYWCVNSTKESMEYSKEAIKLIIKNLVAVVNNPSKQSRYEIMKASNLAGKAINITKTTAPHAVSYTFTSYFGIPHGHAVGLTLGKFLVYNSHVNEKDCVDQRGAKFVKERIKELCVLLDVENANLAKDKINSLMTAIGLEINPHKLGIKEEDLDLIVKNVNTERLVNNPRKITRENLMRILGGNDKF